MSGGALGWSPPGGREPRAEGGAAPPSLVQAGPAHEREGATRSKAERNTKRFRPESKIHLLHRIRGNRLCRRREGQPEKKSGSDPRGVGARSPTRMADGVALSS